jgi:hypothetical protein
MHMAISKTAVPCQPMGCSRLTTPAAACLFAVFIVTGPVRAQKDANLLAPPARLAQAPASVPSRSAPPLATTPYAAASTTTPSAPASSASTVKPQKGPGILPNDHGQQWREYDLSPYTLKIRDVPNPEQAVIDWILRETGTEVWFREPLGILSATGTTLRVYHTPEMQERVRSILERLVGSGSDAHVLGVRLMTVGSPNWRVRALTLLQPVDVKSPGVDAWLLARENAAALLEQLKARADFREHSAPQIEIANGQVKTLSRTQPRNYVRGIQLQREFPFYSTIAGKIDEGYELEISPLLSLDGQNMEAAINCQVDQLEKLVPLTIDVPTGGQSQRVQIQVPQMVSWRLSERFRWPTNEVLLLSCGVVASPEPAASGLFSLLSPLGMPTGRADALLMIEHRPQSVTALASTTPPPPPQQPVATRAPAVPPITKPAQTSASIGPPTGSASSISRGRY